MNVGPVLAYQGKDGCESVVCTRAGYNPATQEMGPCIGWHCAYCDAPCSSQGHRCIQTNRAIEKWERELEVG